MGKVITINFKKDFPEAIGNTVESKTTVKIDGQSHDVITKFQPLDGTIDDYKSYKILYHKKYNISGTVFGKEFNQILRKYESYAFEKSGTDFILTVGNVKGIISRAAFKRLRKDTEVKCFGVKVDLVKAVPLLVETDSDITINSGWFSNLGVDLRNAWLQGKRVNDNPDWIKFVETKGSELKNIELRIEDDSFEKGYILVSLSSRGFLFTTKSISESKCLSITEKIIDLVKEAITINERDDDIEIEEAEIE